MLWEISYQEHDGQGLTSRLIARDKKAILAKLREVVPSASRRGTQEFTAYRLRKEQEQQKEMAAFWEALRRAKARRQREEEAGREQERQRCGEESRTSGPRSSETWRAVLGVSPTATWEEVQTRYRKLAMEHHPDREGEAKDFIPVQLAFEEAKSYFRTTQ